MSDPELAACPEPPPETTNYFVFEYVPFMTVVQFIPSLDDSSSKV